MLVEFGEGTRLYRPNLCNFLQSERQCCAGSRGKPAQAALAVANRSAVYATSLLFAALVGLASQQTLSRHAQAATITELPGGRAALTPKQAEKLTWLALHTRPGQFVFQAGWPGVYLPLSLRNPLFLDKLQSDRRNRLGYLQLTTQQLQAKQVQYIIWSHDLNARVSDWAVFYDFLLPMPRRDKTTLNSLLSIIPILPDVIAGYFPERNICGENLR